MDLSKSRQVIVFTHRLSLFTMLKSAADKLSQKINRLFIYSEHWGKGEPGKVLLWAKKPDAALNNLIDDHLHKARSIYETQGTLEYTPLGKSLCSEFRIVLERIVETILLSGVVQRFSREINTKGKIENLAAINESDCQLVDEMMTKYSGYEHSQSNETPKPVPVPDIIGEDMRKVQDWIVDLNKRKKAIEK